MVALNFSARTVAPNASLEPLPSGTYDAIITNSQEKPTKDGQGSYVEFEFTVRHPDPSLNNRKVFDRLNLRNKSQQAVDIAYGTLSAICHVTQRYDIQDTAQLHGIPLKVIVAKVSRDDRPGEFSNDVKGYKDANGNDPGNAGAAAAGPGPGGQPQGGYNGGYPQGNGGYPQGGNGGYSQQGGPAPGHAQQTSDQHVQNGPQGNGAPQGGYPQQQGGPQQGAGGPPAWAGGGNGQGAPQGGGMPQGQGQGAPQGGPGNGMPQGGAPQGGGEAPPPWARPQ